MWNDSKPFLTTILPKTPSLHMHEGTSEHTFYQNIGSSILVFSLPQEKPLALLQNVLTFSERLQYTAMRPACRFHAIFNSNSPFSLIPNTENCFQLYTCSADHGFTVQKREQQKKKSKKHTPQFWTYLLPPPAQHRSKKQLCRHKPRSERKQMGTVTTKSQYCHQLKKIPTENKWKEIR